MDQEKITKFLKIFAFVVALLAVIYVSINYVLWYVMPFLIAILIAFIIRRPINYISEKLKIRKKIVAPVINLLFVLVITSVLVIVLYRVIGELAAFLSNIPAWVNDYAPAIVTEAEDLFGRILDALPDDLSEDIANIIHSVLDYLSTAFLDFSKSALSWVAGKAASLPSFLLSIVIAVVASFFMAGKTDDIKAAVKRQIPEKYAKVSGELYRKFGSTVLQMLRSYLIIMLITFAELSVGLLILKVDYFLVIAALTAVIDILPILGTGTVLIPWAIVALIMGDTVLGVGLIVLYVIMTVVREIIEPRIVGRQIGLNPVITLFGMYIGLRLFGVSGLFFIPILLILIKSANDMGVIHVWKGPGEKEKPAKEVSSD